MSSLLSNRSAERQEQQERPPSTVRTDGVQSRDGKIGRVFERSLELPVQVVLAVMWLLGAAFMGLCAVAFYSIWLLWTMGA